jgi:hypothetical protein
VLSGLERAAYEYCDEVRSLPEVAGHLRRRFPGMEFSDARLAGFLESLIANRWMVTDRVRYLSLAVRTPHPPAPPA